MTHSIQHISLQLIFMFFALEVSIPAVQRVPVYQESVFLLDMQGKLCLWVVFWFIETSRRPGKAYAFLDIYLHQIVQVRVKNSIMLRVFNLLGSRQKWRKLWWIDDYTPSVFSNSFCYLVIYIFDAGTNLRVKALCLVEFKDKHETISY